MMKPGSIALITIVAVFLALPSCRKKDDDTTTLPSLNGSLSFVIPSYVLPGEDFILTPTGVTNPTTGNVGYYWYSSWNTAKDTTKTETGSGDGSWKLTTPKEIGSYTISGAAYAKDYYPVTGTKSIKVVDPAVDVTLKGADYQTHSLGIVDIRDGGIYYLTTAGGNVWTQNNLYYSASGVSFENSTAIDAIYGRLYTWTEAMSACPSGWHLPSDSDFAKLASSLVEGSTFHAGETFQGAAGAMMADAYFLGSKMWAFWPEVKITNTSKFSAIPVGYAIDQEGSQRFQGNNSYAVFWTSDGDAYTGVYRYIHAEKNNVLAAQGDKDSFRASVRCVKD